MLLQTHISRLQFRVTALVSQLLWLFTTTKNKSQANYAVPCKAWFGLHRPFSATKHRLRLNVISQVLDLVPYTTARRQLNGSQNLISSLLRNPEFWGTHGGGRERARRCCCSGLVKLRLMRPELDTA